LQRNLFTHNRKFSKITAAMAGVTVIVPAAVATGLTVSGASAGKSASAVNASSMLAMAGARTATASPDDRMRLAGAARHRVAKLEVSRVRAERAADRAAKRAAARRAAQRAAALRAQQAAAAAPAPAPSSQAPAASAPQPSGNPQQIASGMLGSFGWSSSEFSCLVSLWNLESGWNVYASNPSSGAYGIPQALPGSKMASAGPDWQSNAATQIRWGLGYIKADYGSPCGAWSHEQASGWY
jgi:hypothetical protein